jgi:hypothetical protein
MTRVGRTLMAAVALAAGICPGAADAQTSGNRPLRRLDVAAGAGLLGGAALGARDANIRANSSPPEPFRLFSTDSSFERAGMFEVRLGTALTKRYEIEGRFSLSHPELQSSISADVENAPGLTIVERVDQYQVDAAVLVVFDEMRVAGVVPFASAGGGYLRQLHEGLTVIEAGRVYHVGGGLKHWFGARNRGFARAAGIRLDARLYLLSGGISLDDGPRPHPAISGSFFVTF